MTAVCMLLNKTISSSLTTEDVQEEEVEDDELDEESLSTLNSFSDAMKALDNVKRVRLKKQSLLVRQWILLLLPI